MPTLPDVESLVSDASASTEGFIDRLNIVDPSTYPDTLIYIWIAALAAGVGICLYTPLFRRIEIVSTLAHELGHGLGGMFAGRKFRSFSLHPDASGVTSTAGAGRLGLIFCFWSGYAAPGTVAVLIAIMFAAGIPSWPYILTLFVLAMTFLRARSLTTVAVLCLVGVGALGIGLSDSVELQTTVLSFLIGFFITAGIRQISDAWKQRKIDGGTADGDALASLTFIPESVWLILFYLYTGACATASAVLLTSVNWG